MFYNVITLSFSSLLLLFLPYLFSDFGLLYDLYENLGRQSANFDWTGAYDPHGLTKTHSKLRSQLLRINHTIDKIFNNLSISLDESKIRKLRNIFFTASDTAYNNTSKNIELSNRPPNMIYDQTAFINLTNIQPDIDIQMLLSFGHRFMLPYNITKHNAAKSFAMLECAIDKAIDPIIVPFATKEIYFGLKDFEKKVIIDPIAIWLNFINTRTYKFFKQNPHIAAIRSDKGNHTVLITIEEYNTKILEHLNDQAYIQIHDNPLQQLISKETAFIDILKANKRTCNLVPFFQPNTLNLARFHGLIKIHKNNKIRPITDTCTAPGYTLSRIICKIINSIIPIESHHIRDVVELKDQLDLLRIRSDDILVSMDVVSMYTTIPTNLVIKLIMKHSHTFYNRYSLPTVLFTRMLEFILNECTFFTFNDMIFKQTQGLPMGGCISALAARLVMDDVIDFYQAAIPIQPTFLKLFVDDSIFIINQSMASLSLDILNIYDFNVLRFVMEQEDSSGSINFLNMTLTRHNHEIITNWYSKPYASKRLLNYHSSHKRSIIMGTAQNFIKTVLKLSHGKYFTTNKQLIIDRLRANNFPETSIIALLNEHYTYMRPYSVNANTYIHHFYNPSIPNPKPAATRKTYVSFPHNIICKNIIKQTLHHYKGPNIVLADSIKNTKINYISSLKTKIPLDKQTNVFLLSTCKCNRKIRILLTPFNQTAGMFAHRVTNSLVKCTNDIHAFKKIKYIKGLCYNGQNKAYLKYLKLRYNRKINASFTELPNTYFQKLIKLFS